MRLRLPRDVYFALRRGLWLEGVEFKKQFRATVAGKFKSGGKRVANAIRVYTDGSGIEGLRLGIFTRWSAAPIYEEGGTITPGPGRSWLIFPVTPRAYTPGGRVKRSWRTKDGRFKRELFEDLRPVRVRGRGGSGWLLVRDRGVSKSGRVGKVTKRRGVEAVEPVFLMIRQTSRRAVLQFFSDFTRSAGVRGDRLQRRIIRAADRSITTE